MSKSFFSCDSVTHEGKSNTWFTPKNIIGDLGVFDLDPCTMSFRPFDSAIKHYEFDKGEDGLALPWHGKVWLNPPYGKNTGVWLEKLHQHGNGIALVFTAFETRWGQEALKEADGVYLLSGRISFLNEDGEVENNAGKGSCLLIYGQDNLIRFFPTNLKGIMMKGCK